jgi:predicted ATPase
VISEIQISNYKSIEDETLSLGRVNVFIGENGGGKSNLLEAIALAGAAQSGKLDNEFLASRGIRVSPPKLMRSGFRPRASSKPIIINVRGSDQSARFQIQNDNLPYSSWECAAEISVENSLKFEDLAQIIASSVRDVENKEDRDEILSNLAKQLTEQVNKQFQDSGAKPGETVSLSLQLSSPVNLHQSADARRLADFLIYSPENSALRSYEREGQIEPLGINGEGLLRFLNVLATGEDRKAIDCISKNLHVFSWFDSFRTDDVVEDQRLEVIDRFLSKSRRWFDQRSTNEGFLLVLFYLAAFSNKYTPSFFAIDNVDTSLNPRLCTEVVKLIALLSKENDKQTILTGHNPAMLDGLDLTDPDQRLFVIYRNREGRTKTRRVMKPKSDFPTRLSELFLRGLIGGVPKGF